MSFIATNFSFGGTPSEELGLTISSLDNNGDVIYEAGNDVQLITQPVYRRPVPYFYGVNQNKVLTFDVMLTSPNEIDSNRSSVIMNILFGQMIYKKLRIVQGDMGDIYMNCFLLNPKIRKIGGQIIGYSATVQCDSPWAWQYSKTRTFTYATTPTLINATYTLNNLSANNAYTFPLITFKMQNGISIAQGYFNITNITDSSRMTLFGYSHNALVNLASGETMTVDNDLQILSSSTLFSRMNYFNKKWFRLLQGRNNLSWRGYIQSFTITYANAIKI